MNVDGKTGTMPVALVGYLFVAMELYVYSRTISMAVVGCQYVNAAHRTRLYYGLQRAHGPY